MRWARIIMAGPLSLKYFEEFDVIFKKHYNVHSQVLASSQRGTENLPLSLLENDGEPGEDSANPDDPFPVNTTPSTSTSRLTTVTKEKGKKVAYQTEMLYYSNVKLM